jgi:hypothetical protein
MQPTETPTETDFAKLAVLIDCEAHIEITTDAKHRYHALQITVGNRESRLLEWCVSHFKGFVCRQNYRKIPGPTYAPVRRWRVTSWEAASILNRCLPHFIFKREQAEIALEFQKTFSSPGTRITASDIDRRENLRAKLRSLTKKGPRPSVEEDPKTHPESNLFAKDFPN